MVFNKAGESVTLVVLFVLIISYGTIGAVKAQGALRKLSNPDGSIDTWGDPVNCYEYTWKGPWNDRFNESDQSTCGSLNQKGMPCYHPFVWTAGEFRFNQPLGEVIEQQCKIGDIYGAQCNPLCMKNSNTLAADIQTDHSPVYSCNKITVELVHFN